jgi:oligopeptide transport system substrate-binding protein
VLLAGCAEEAPRALCPEGQRCLRAGNFAEPGSLDPARTFVKPEQTVVNDLFVGLATFDAEGEPIPGMAHAWSVTADGLAWTFHLRPAVWSDGAPLTSADFVYSLRRLADPRTASPYASLVYPFVNARRINEGQAPPQSLGVEAPDPRTLVIRLEHPVSYMPELVAHPSLLPTPQHVVERHGAAWTAPANFVGNGPFRLLEWRLGDRLTLVKNPRFYDAAKVCLDRVDYFPTTDVVTAERQIRRGELDLNVGFSASRTRYLQRDPQMSAFVRTHPWTDVFYVVFNQRHPPFGDVRVRQALAGYGPSR